MDLVTVFSLKVQIILAVLAFGTPSVLYAFFYVRKTLKMKQLNKKCEENPERSSRYIDDLYILEETTFIEWLNDSFLRSATFLLGTLVSFGVIIVLGISVGNIYSNRVNEDVVYAEMANKKQALENVVNETEDIINTDLYNQVVSFNTKLGKMQTYSTHPNYSINFSGNCDWYAIEPIVVVK